MLLNIGSVILSVNLSFLGYLMELCLTALIHPGHWAAKIPSWPCREPAFEEKPLQEFTFQPPGQFLIGHWQHLSQCPGRSQAGVGILHPMALEGNSPRQQPRCAGMLSKELHEQERGAGKRFRGFCWLGFREQE